MTLLAHVMTILTTSPAAHETIQGIFISPLAHVSAANSTPDSTPPIMTLRNHSYSPPYLREAAVAHLRAETTVDRHADGPLHLLSKMRKTR
jgi:hypothetical protein